MEEKGRFRAKTKQKTVDLFDICIVILVQNNEEYLSAIFHGVDNQSLPPREIVIVDSGSNNIISNLINEWKGAVPIKHIKIDSAYPGDARNIGVDMVKVNGLLFWTQQQYLNMVGWKDV